MPVPEALSTIAKYGVPGIITVTDGTHTKNLYINEGKVHFASSDNVDERLGEFLLYQGIITKEQYDRSVEMMKRYQIRQGRAFVMLSILTPKELYTYVREQVKNIVLSVFSWKEGIITFKPGLYKMDEIIKLNISIPQLILEGIRAVKDARWLVQRLGKATEIYKLTANYEEKLAQLSLSDEAKKLLSQVDGKKTLRTLIATPSTPPSENAKILYGLYCLGLIEKKTSRGIIKVQL